MRKLLLAGAAMFALSSSAFAVTECKPLKDDSRVCTVPYNPNQVTSIWGTLRAIVVIQFGDKERIASVSAGDIDLVKPENMGPNILALKPVPTDQVARQIQPIAVTTTNADTGLTRLYMLEFKLRTGGSILEGTDGAQFVVRFTYPGDVAAAAAEVWRQKERVKIEHDIEARTATIGRGSISGQNGYACDYIYQTPNDKHPPPFVPTRVCDDGQKTFILFPGNMPLPAFSVDGPDGEPMITDGSYDAAGSYYVINRVVRHIYLRSGDAVVCIWKQSEPNPAGFNPGTNTNRRDVERTTLGDGK
jgi:type IV secretion system protein VirB9